MGRWTLAAVLIALSLAQATRTFATPAADAWKALSFLAGTWDARTRAGSAGAQVSGTYTFRHELNNHVLARYSDQADCKAPQAYDCKHGDLFYVYQDGDDQPLRALYLDSEGHVIHYSVSTPESATALFVSDANAPGPQFQLVYLLKGGVMSGKFQMRMPGQTEWKSYLEWSGAKHRTSLKSAE